MRVPIRSAGTRSGVNWIRLNSQSMTRAAVLIASVLASPGTPSISTWPRARSATAGLSARPPLPPLAHQQGIRIRRPHRSGGIFRKILRRMVGPVLQQRVDDRPLQLHLVAARERRLYSAHHIEEEVFIRGMLR